MGLETGAVDSVAGATGVMDSGGALDLEGTLDAEGTLDLKCALDSRGVLDSEVEGGVVVMTGVTVSHIRTSEKWSSCYLLIPLI